MGYTTEFLGSISLSRKLTLREAKEWLDIYDGIFDSQPTSLDPRPDGYLQWLPTETLDGIVWDGEEKFYDYPEWLLWAIEKFIEPQGIIANGVIVWSGEDADDHGQLEVTDNKIKTIRADKDNYSYLSPLTRIKLAEMAIKSI